MVDVPALPAVTVMPVAVMAKPFCTTVMVRVPLDGAKLESPEYVAEITCVPADEEENV